MGKEGGRYGSRDNEKSGDVTRQKKCLGEGIGRTVVIVLYVVVRQVFDCGNSFGWQDCGYKKVRGTGCILHSIQYPWVLAFELP